MLTTKIFIFVLILFFDKLCYCKKYYNYTLYRGMPVNKQHLNFFNNITALYNVSYWRPVTMIYKPVEFVIPPEHKTDFLKFADRNDIYLTTIIPDIQSAFDKQTVKTYIRRNMNSFDWRSYFRLTDIYSWLKDVSKMFPKEVTLFSIGRTAQKREILAAKILLNGTQKRSTVIVEGGIHAREWIGPAFVTYMLWEILQAPYSKNKNLRTVAFTYEWYFVPVLNPDGYEYSHEEDRLWRKNRAGFAGVDINRNFGFAFGTVGVSRSRESDIFCGTSAFSEKESRAMADLVKTKSGRLEYYLAFHSYGQYMILPYTHTSKHVENFDEVRQMAMEAANSLKQKYGTKYSVGTAYDTVGYRTSGVSGCWVKNTYKVPYVMTMELRDSGRDGFALPTDQIIPTCRETMAGLQTFLKPRTSSFKKLKSDRELSNGQSSNLPRIIICNVLMFIIVYIY